MTLTLFAGEDLIMTKTNAVSPIKAGERFKTREGYWCSVLKVENSKRLLVKIEDEFGHRFYTQSGHLRRGHIKNPFHRSVYGVGRTGVGGVKATIGQRATREYALWKSMLERCYAEGYWEQYPTYTGCRVADEWHCLQEFGAWIRMQPFDMPGFQLDKDILAPGNKTYSPDTCALVPAEINNLLLDCGARRGRLPMGVVYRDDLDSYIATVGIGNRNRHLGVFKCAGDAFAAYKSAKEQRVKEIANRWRGRLDPRVIDALMRWEVPASFDPVGIDIEGGSHD